MIDQIKTKVSNNIRINDEEALYLYRDLDLLTLGKLAQEKRFKLVPNKSVSFVIDTNLNYTNICDAYCSFCAFYRTDPDDPSSYTYSVDEMIKKVEDLKKQNIKIDNQSITEVLTVNGVRFSLTDGSWGLIRASSNKPSLVVVTESPTSDERKKKIFEFIDKLLQKTGKIGEYDQKI